MKTATPDKTCSTCGEDKPLTAFPSQKRRGGIYHLPHCRKCWKAHLRAEYKRDRTERLRKRREYLSKNPEKARQWQADNLERNRLKYNATRRDNKNVNTHLSWLRRLKKMGIAEAEYNSRFEQQGGLCLICHKSGEGRFNRLCADHDHRTGKFRGLICNQCNSGLGHFKDNPEFLRAAIAYLEAA